MWGTRKDVGVALVAAVLGHMGLATLLFVGLPWFQSEPQPEPVVQAMIVTDVEGRLGRIERERKDASAAQRAEQVRQERERDAQERQRQAEQVAAQREAERAEAQAIARREAEEQARKQAREAAQRAEEEQAQREAEAEARRQAEAAAKAEADRKAREEEAKRKAEEARKRKEEEERRKAEEERKRQEEEARRKAEEERQRKEAARRKREAQEQARREAALAEAMAAEENAREQSALATVRQDYVFKIKHKVAQNWLQPPGVNDDFECRVKVRQLPDGSVIDVQIMDSCGNTVLDDSVIRAVNKSDPLPTGDSRVFEETVIFTFKPQDG